MKGPYSPRKLISPLNLAVEMTMAEEGQLGRDSEKTMYVFSYSIADILYVCPSVFKYP